VALPALYLKRALGIPTILDWADWYGRNGTATERGPWIRLLMEPVETFCEEVFHPLADGCVAMGEPLFNRALSAGVPEDRMLNLLHGCDPNGLVPIDAKRARQRLPGLSQRGYLLGYLGVMRRSSAQLLLRAFELIKRRAGETCRLVLIGNPRLAIADYVPPDCREDVIETGWVSYGELNLYLAACDLLLLPFVRTTATSNIWPSKLNDHLSVGRPTLGTRMDILESTFDRNRIGLLTEDNPEDFAEACMHLLEDPELRTEMGQNARSLAEGELSWNFLTHRLEDFYSRLISARS
jgi:glycosyltransferase involved in cell wall biosynthesis